MTYSVGELVEMARALSEGEFDQQFQQDFKGELGQLASYLEAVRQTLSSLSSTASNSKELLPAAADGVAEINREAETGFNSVWQVIESMQADQSKARDLLELGASRLHEEQVSALQIIVGKNHQHLLELMSYLSFQDVLRQRLEKVQKIISQVEEKTLELIVKFRVKSNEQTIKDGDGSGLDQGADLDQNLVDQLMAKLR